MSEVKKDCFAYYKRNLGNGQTNEACMALNAPYCKSGECKFYKTADQACEDCTYADCQGCYNRNNVLRATV